VGARAETAPAADPRHAGDHFAQGVLASVALQVQESPAGDVAQFEVLEGA